MINRIAYTEGSQMLCLHCQQERLTAHRTDALCNAILHADDAHLRDRILIEELVDKLFGVFEHEFEARGTQVAVLHAERQVQYQEDVSDDASLNRVCVLQQSTPFGSQHKLVEGAFERARLVFLYDIPRPLEFALEA